MSRSPVCLDSTEYHYAPFYADLTSWQFISYTIVPKKPELTVDTITVVCAYEGNSNVAYFDNISLVQEVAQTMAYDDNGNLVSVNSTGLSEQSSTYNGGNLMQSVTGGNGTYNYAYSDAANSHRLTAVSNDLITQTLTYDAQGNVTGTALFATPAADKADGVDTITETVSGIYLESSATYSNSGNHQATVTDSNGNTTTYAYSDLQHQTYGIPNTVKDAKNTLTSYTTDVFGRYRNITVDNGAGLKYVYGKTRLHQIVRQESGSTDLAYQFYYDVFDNLTALRVGKSITSNYLTAGITLATYEYGSSNGLLTKQAYGNGDYITFTYDDLGRTKTATYSDGRVLTYSYTGDGQLYSTHDSKTGYTYQYTYDSIGRLIASSVKNSSNTVLMQTRQEYNANNQLVGQYWTVGGTTYSETYTYSKIDGALTSYNNALGQTIKLEYDALRRISKVDTTTLDRNYTYLDVSDGQTTGLVSSVYYTTANGGSTYYNYSYAYDALGNISSYTRSGTTYTYTYDDQNQLLTQTGGGKTYTYTYDNAGNILTASNGTTTHTYTYGNAVWRDLLTAFDGESITYDGSGNPLSYYNGTRYTFTWEEGRNLVSATSGSNTYTYAYDSNGLRISKVENGKTHTYLYASGKLLRETISENDVVTDTLDFFYDHNGHPYALRYTANGTTTNYYYITNLQGDVLAMISGSGVSVASYSYDPYGKVLTASGTMATINPLRYRGYYYDTETGFYYLQSRYYDPNICRFINADAYVSTGQGVVGCNMFVYCLNNPLCYIDLGGNNAKLSTSLYEPGVSGYTAEEGDMSNYPGVGEGTCYSFDAEDLAIEVVAIHENISAEDVESWYAEIASDDLAAQNSILSVLLPEWITIPLDCFGLLAPYSRTTDRYGNQLYIEAGYTIVTMDRVYYDIAEKYSAAEIEYFVFNQNGSLVYNDKVIISHFIG